MNEMEIDKMHADIALALARAAQAGKSAKWYEVIIAIAGTLAIVAITKLFL